MDRANVATHADARNAPSSSARRATLVISAGAALVVLGFATRAPFRVAAELELARGTGWAAVAHLFTSLAMSPAVGLFGARRSALFAALRRTFGLAALVFACAHFAIVLATRLAPDVALLVFEPQNRAGLASLVILALLGLTSFSPVNRALRVRAWKELHRLVYAAALLAVLHVALSSMAPVGLLVGASALLAALFLVRIGLGWIGQARRP